jgi:hypothetical protein
MVIIGSSMICMLQETAVALGCFATMGSMFVVLQQPACPLPFCRYGRHGRQGLKIPSNVSCGHRWSNWAAREQEAAQAAQCEANNVRYSVMISPVSIATSVKFHIPRKNHTA